MKYPLVSVLIPVYQVEKYLQRCIDSVLCQTYPNIEIIMIDDASTDQSESIARNFANSYDNIYFYTTSHSGVSAVRNQLLSKAKGEYVFFVDSDDFLAPQIIETLYSILEKYSVDIVQCEYIRTRCSEIDREFPTDYQVKTYTGCQAIDSLLRSDDKLRCMVWAKLYKKNVFNNVLFPVGKIHEDEAVMHRLFWNSRLIASVSLPMYYYYRNPCSIMNKKFSYDKYDILSAIRDRIDFCEDKNLCFSRDMSCVRYCFECVRLYRLTVDHLENDSLYLAKLKSKYINMAKQCHKIEGLDSQILEMIENWCNDPLIGEIPDFWVYSTEYYLNNKEKSTCQMHC